MNLKQFTVSMLGQEVKFLSILGINEETGIVVGYMEPVPGNDHLSFLGVIIAFPDNRGYTLSEIGECTILLDLPSSVSFLHVQVNNLITIKPKILHDTYTLFLPIRSISIPTDSVK